MAILMVALRDGMCKQPYETPEPNAHEEVDTGVLKDASTSTDNLKNPTQMKKIATQALSARDEVRLVEWLRKRLSRVPQSMRPARQGRNGTPQSTIPRHV